MNFSYEDFQNQRSHPIYNIDKLFEWNKVSLDDPYPTNIKLQHLNDLFIPKNLHENVMKV